MWTYNKDYLMHYGILGMKWGIRRYQNKDGTLTELGKRRANSLEKKYEAVTGHKVVPADAASRGYTSKQIDKMSNAELNERLTRLKIENAFIESKQRREALEYKPPKESKAKKILGKIASEAGGITKNLVQTTAKSWLNDLWDEKWGPELGLDTKTRAKTIKRLEEEVKERELEAQKRYFEGLTADEWADRFRKKNQGNSNPAPNTT